MDEAGGHGIGWTQSQSDALITDIAAFLLWSAGVPGWQPTIAPYKRRSDRGLSSVCSYRSASRICGFELLSSFHGGTDFAVIQVELAYLGGSSGLTRTL